MSFRDDLITVLTGGIGGLIDGDGGQPAAGTVASPPARPEVTPPEPQLQDREPFLQRVTQTQLLVGTAVLVGAIGLLAFVRR